jgi:hypothetical protein
MLAYQLDRCSDYPALCKKCIEQGLAKIFRFSVLKTPDTTPDPDLFSSCQQFGRALLTTDGTFHTDNENKIPEPHHGIVIVNTVAHKPLTSKMAISTLAKFKDYFADWHLVSPTNSILYLTEEWVDLYRIMKGRARWQGRFHFHESGSKERLDEALRSIGATWDVAG